MNALLVVDVQNDFLPTGALPVADGDAVIRAANSALRSGRFGLTVGTQDWHPANHGSFASNHPGSKPGQVVNLDGLQQILWPAHCVQNTFGAAFAPGLESGRFQRVFQKGTDPRIDSYSGFFDNGHRKSTGLGEYLKERGVTEVAVLGLATDYCVKFTALDARQLGLGVALLVDGCRAVNVRAGDDRRAIQEMQDAGVRIETFGAP
ncbi:bifunctional nicotinamidase/pyrazinamidase [Opitutaceae bacterium EW11]|nr:bifunctional nicotinamidase/pyrazinamidase [Opitutaceae bacterium EW11]